MSIPTLEQLKAAAEVSITWGFWMIVYGSITMLIGLVLIAFCDARTIKVVRKLLNN
jgi:hypothetical protein